MLRFDGDKAAALDKWYQSPDVQAQREFVLEHVNPQKGEHILDVGVGPGFLALALAEAVGSTGFVHGIDVSPSMVEIGRKRCESYPHVLIEEGDACQLTAIGKGLYDCVISTQVYEYVEDIQTALREAFAVLRPTGRVIILDTDFTSVVWHTSDIPRMEKMLVAYDKHLADPHLPQTLRTLLTQTGFQNELVRPFCICNASCPSDSYSRALMTTMHQFVTENQHVPLQEADEWKKEQEALHESDCFFFSLNRYLFQARKPE